MVKVLNLPILAFLCLYPFLVSAQEVENFYNAFPDIKNFSVCSKPHSDDKELDCLKEQAETKMANYYLSSYPENFWDRFLAFVETTGTQRVNEIKAAGYLADVDEDSNIRSLEITLFEYIVLKSCTEDCDKPLHVLLENYFPEGVEVLPKLQSCCHHEVLPKLYRLPDHRYLVIMYQSFGAYQGSYAVYLIEKKNGHYQLKEPKLEEWDEEQKKLVIRSSVEITSADFDVKTMILNDSSKVGGNGFVNTSYKLKGDIFRLIKTSNSEFENCKDSGKCDVKETTSKVLPDAQTH